MIRVCETSHWVGQDSLRMQIHGCPLSCALPLHMCCSSEHHDALIDLLVQLQASTV